MVLLPLGVVLIAGCQSMGERMIPTSEYQSFTPKPPEKRVMNEVKVRWEVRDDVTAYCAKSIGMGREQANLTPPLACASWHAEKKECVIVTGNPTTHVALGHEIRHCFEGHFH